MTFRGPSTLSLGVSLLIAAAGPAFAAKWPEWADEALTSFHLERYESEDAVVVLDEWRLKLRGGERTGLRRRIIHVYTEEGREGARVMLPSGQFRRYDRVRLWVRHPDGTVRRFTDDDGTLLSAGQLNLLDDTRVLLLAPPGLSPGSTVAVESTVFRAADWPQDLFVPQGPVPVARAAVSIDARKGWRAVARVAGTTNPGPPDTVGEATWEFVDLPALPRGWRGLAPLPPTIALALNYAPPDAGLPFASWRSTALWLRDLFHLPGGEQPRLERLSEEIKNSGRDPVEAAGRIARSLRYFAVELGWGAYVPRPPESTLQRAFGDCKDKTQVMLALLRNAGVEAYPVLAVAPSDRYVHDDLPSPLVFNHVVAGIPWADRERRPGMTIVEDSEFGPLRLYDPTIPEGSVLDISLLLHGGAGLVLHPKTSGVLRFPGNDHEGNRYIESHQLRIREDGAVETATTVRAYGLLREVLESEDGGAIASEELRRQVFEELGSRDPELVELNIEDLRLESDGAWVYEYSYISPYRLSEFGELRLLHVGAVAPTELLPIAEEDEETIYVPLRGMLSSSYAVEFDGWRLVSGIKPLDVANSVGRIEMRLDTRGSELRLERAMTLAASKVSPEVLDEVMALRDALRRVNGAALIFERR
jgi:hypothetical protein